MKLTQRLSHKFVPLNSLPGYGSFPIPQIINGRIVGIADNKHNYISKAYAINDIIYSVVNVVLDKIKVAPWSVYKIVDEQSLKHYRAMINTKNLYGAEFVKAMNLRKKALEPVKENSKLHELLEWPNEKETFPDLIGNGCGYEMLTGDHFMWALLLNAGANAGLPQELHNLPSQDMTIIASNSWPVRELGYSLGTFRLDFTKAQVLHRANWDPSTMGANDGLFGMSPLKAALSTIARSNAAVIAGASAFDNMGIAGVLYVDDPRFDGEQGFAQANAVKEVLYNEYTGPENTGKIGTSGYKLGWQSIGVKPVDLGIIESEKWDQRKICNIFGVPSSMMNDVDNTKYANWKEGEAALTSRCAVPRMNKCRSHINRMLHLYWGVKDKRQVIDYDPNVFTELRQNTKDVVDWSNGIKMITANEQRELAGMDARQEPEADELIFQGQLLRDQQTNIVDDEIDRDEED